MKGKPLNMWVTAGLFALLYTLIFKTLLTAWINPQGNEFTFKEYGISLGEAIISLGSLYLAYTITKKFFSRSSLGYQYAIILLLSILINASLFLPYWVFFVRLLLHGLPTDKEAYAGEVWSRTLSLHVPIAVIIMISLYNNYAHKTELQLVNVQKALAETQLKNLQQQVDPHFLFNSLNILCALIKIDPDKSVVFTQKLSEIYRFFLKNQKDILFSLKEELDFVYNYFYLVEVRFGKAFTVNIQNRSSSGFESIYIIPGTIQLLVENVIKHNTANDEQPIEIMITIGDDNISVVNAVVKKENRTSGYGLNNLATRYKLFNKENVNFFEKNGMFYVQIPLIKNAA